MSPLAARLDRFVRWFVIALPADAIETSTYLPQPTSIVAERAKVPA